MCLKNTIVPNLVLGSLRTSNVSHFWGGESQCPPLVLNTDYCSATGNTAHLHLPATAPQRTAPLSGELMDETQHLPGRVSRLAARTGRWNFPGPAQTWRQRAADACQ